MGRFNLAGSLFIKIYYRYILKRRLSISEISEKHFIISEIIGIVATFMIIKLLIFIEPFLSKVILYLWDIVLSK